MRNDIHGYSLAILNEWYFYLLSCLGPGIRHIQEPEKIMLFISFEKRNQSSSSDCRES